MKIVSKIETEEVVRRVCWVRESEVSSGWRGREHSWCLQGKGKPSVAHQCVGGDPSQATG